MVIFASVIIGFRQDLNARMAAFLSLTDFSFVMICFGFGLNTVINGKLEEGSFPCSLQAMLTWWMIGSSSLCLSVIAINSYKVMFYSEPLSRRQEVIAYLIVYGLPLLTSIFPLLQHGSRNGHWCSFSSTQRIIQLTNILCYFLIPLVIITFCYTYTSREVHLRVGRHRSNSVSSKHSRVIKRMSYFILAYLVVWTPLVVCYLYELVKDHLVPFWAECISMSLLYLQGFINCFLYGYTQDLGKNWINWLRINIAGLPPLPDENNTGTSMPNTPVPSQSRYGSRAMTPSNSTGSIKRDLEEGISMEVMSESPKSINVVTFADDLCAKLEKEQSQE